MSNHLDKMLKALDGVDVVDAAVLERVAKIAVKEHVRNQRAKERDAAQKAAANLRKQAVARRAASGAAATVADLRPRAVIADVEQRLAKSTDPTEQAELRLRLTRERLVQLYNRGVA
jgi:hypothetical protein